MSLFGKKKKKPVVLVEGSSPVCDLQAVVEEDGECVYLYLLYGYGQEEEENRWVNSCWVCNLKAAPEEMDLDAMQKGQAPMMPADFCKNANGEPPLKQQELELIWTEEGNGVALSAGGKLAAFVPSWADRNMPGYSVFAKGTGPFAWTMDEAYQNLMNRVNKSRSFWEAMESDYFAELQDKGLHVLEDFLQTKDYKYYAIDGGNFPPKALISAEKDGFVYGVTLGVCAIPQPNVEEWHQEEAGAFRRIELGFACQADVSQETVMKMLGHMSSQAELPWRNLTWLGHEHTISCDAFPGFPAVTIVNTALIPEVNVPRYEDFMGDRVNLLWLVPITQKEYELAMTKEQPMDVLLPLYHGKMDELLIFDGKAKFLGE